MRGFFYLHQQEKGIKMREIHIRCPCCGGELTIQMEDGGSGPAAFFCAQNEPDNVPGLELGSAKDGENA